MDVICKRCFLEEESLNHLFFNCHYAQAIWRASGIPNPILLNEQFKDKLEFCINNNISKTLPDYADIPLWILWRLWKSRNQYLFQRKNDHWLRTYNYAKQDSLEWNGALVSDQTWTQQVHTSSNHSRQEHRKWKPPDHQNLKCNVDGSFR